MFFFWQKCFVHYLLIVQMLRSLNNIHATWQTVYCVFIFCSEKNGVDQDQKILTDEQPAIEGNKGAPESKNFSG
jgi:hypothetical protein